MSLLLSGLSWIVFYFIYDTCKFLLLGKGLPDIHSILKHFRDAFEWVEADRSGCIIPHVGVDIEYDAACLAISNLESNLTKYLKEQQKALGEPSVMLSFIVASFDFCSFVI